VEEEEGFFFTKTEQRVSEAALVVAVVVVRAPHRTPGGQEKEAPPFAIIRTKRHAEGIIVMVALCSGCS
jgi:hypothetical protein